MNRLRVQEQAGLWCASASVVVVGVGLVTAPVHIERSVFRPELRTGVVLESAVTQLSALVNAAALAPTVPHGTTKAATPSANAGNGCGIDGTFGLCWAVIGFLAVFVAPVWYSLQLVFDAIKTFVAKVFPNSASAAAESVAADRRTPRPGGAAAATVIVAAAKSAATQASSAAVALPVGTAVRTAAPHRRGGVQAVAAHRAASPHAAAAARPARAATRAGAHTAAATPRTLR